MNWYKKAQYDMYGQPLEFREESDVPDYQDLISDKEHEWYSYPFEDRDYKKGPIRDYKKEMEGLTGKIKWMSPDEYIDTCINGAYEFYKDSNEYRDIISYEQYKHVALNARRSSISEDDKSLIESYKDRWVAGEQPPMGHLKYFKGEFTGQEGMHRALMAKDLGIIEMPVLIINED